MFWTNGYVYDAKKVLAIDPNAPVDSWDMFFKPEVLSKFTSCGVSILNSPEDVMDLAQNYLHLHPGKNDPEEVKQAGDLVAKSQPHVARSIQHGTISALADGSRCLAMTWSGDYSQACPARRRTAPMSSCISSAQGRREHGLRRHGDPEGRQECRRGA